MFSEYMQNLQDMPVIFNYVLKSIGVLFASGIIIFVIKRLLHFAFETSKKKFPQKNYDTFFTVLSSVVKYAVYFFAIFQILDIFGASKETILALASVGSIAMGFGARGIAEDFITGVSILFENQFRVGDFVNINEKSGTVESIGMRITTIRGFNGDVHIFPNSTIKLVTNMSKSFNRAVVEIPVSYYEEIDKIIAMIKEEMLTMETPEVTMITQPNVQGVVNMSGLYLTVRIVVDCEVGEQWAVEREIRRVVKVRFEKEGVKPPIVPIDFNGELK